MWTTSSEITEKCLAITAQEKAPVKWWVTCLRKHSSKLHRYTKINVYFCVERWTGVQLDCTRTLAVCSKHNPCNYFSSLCRPAQKIHMMLLWFVLSVVIYSFDGPSSSRNYLFNPDFLEVPNVAKTKLQYSISPCPSPFVTTCQFLCSSPPLLADGAQDKADTSLVFEKTQQ